MTSPSTSSRPVARALVEAAVSASGADQGWLLAAHADGLRVLAAFGGTDPGSLLETVVAIDGARGLAVSSGHPAALQPPAGDRSNEGAGGAEGTPGAVLAAPCNHEDVVGVLEVVRARGAEAFTFDDVEIIALLGEIGGAVIAADDGGSAEVTPPARLSQELIALAQTDAQRYADVARVVEALLGQG